MARKALSIKNSPRGFRLTFFIVLWLLMDRLQSPAVVQGVVWTLAAIYAIGNVIDFFTAEDVELEA